MISFHSVNIPAIYLHVINVSKELTECPVDELCLPSGEKKYSAESALSVAEMNARSVMTVHLLADKKVQLPSEVHHDSKSPKPCIVLVGTHLHEVDEKNREAPHLHSSKAIQTRKLLNYQ